MKWRLMNPPGLGLRQSSGAFGGASVSGWGKSGRGLPQSKTWRTDRASRNARSVLDCASPLALSHGASPFRCYIKIVRHVQLIRLKTINRLHHRLRSLALKPSCRAPRILIRDRHQSMFHRILVNVIQSCEIGLLVRKPCLSKIEPHLTPLCAIQFVDPFAGSDVHHAQHIREARSISSILRRMRDEVVMIREHSPCFEVPAVIACDGEQTAVQHAQTIRAAEVMRLLVCAGGYEVSALVGKLMCGCVRPLGLWLGHGSKVFKRTERVESDVKAAEDCRSPRRFAFSRALGLSARFWTAPSPLALFHRRFNT